MTIKRVLWTTLLSILLVSGNVYLGYSQSDSQKDIANIDVVLNSQKYEFADQKALAKNNILYLPVRELAESLGAQVTWKSDCNTLSILQRGNLLQFNLNTGRCTKNSEIILPPMYMTVNNKIMFSAQFLCRELGAEMYWDQPSQTIALRTDGKQPSKADISIAENAYNAVLTSAFKTYTDNDVYWLSRIVHAEAQGESYLAKLAVANVILNRVRDSKYPNSIKEVIFDVRFGVQFTPTSNGSIYNDPSKESVRAALDALSGKNNAQDVLFFINPDIAVSNWVSTNRQLAFRLENHNFYY